MSTPSDAGSKRTRPTSLNGRSLLAIFAHPDDESLACGGLLARCADLGARVSLLCATRGGNGPRPDASPATSSTLGAVRPEELAAAARTLGVAEVILLDYEDGMLPWVDNRAFDTDIADTIRRLHPDVVVTFGEDGLYWHPDHIAVHERVTDVVATLGDAAPALYYVSMPPGSMRRVVDHVREEDAAAIAGQHRDPPLLILGIADADAFGAFAPAPTLVVDVGAFAARKLAALKCHRTQMAGSALNLIADADAARLLGVEHYRRADVGAAGDAFLEALRAPDTRGRVG